LNAEGEQDAGLGWREILLQRLLIVGAPVIGAAVLMGLAATHGRERRALIVLLPFVPLLLITAYARTWPFKLRASLLIAPLVLAVFIVYAVLGFKATERYWCRPVSKPRRRR
jgi:hypothetical protein